MQTSSLRSIDSSSLREQAHAAPSGQARLLVVVPTLNEGAHIAPLLQALNDDLRDHPEALLVVVDGGSSDDTCALVQRFAAKHANVRLLDNPLRLQSAALNLAVKRFGADADVVVRCDAHCEYPRGFFSSLVSTLERTQADAVVVPMDTVGRTRFQRALAQLSNTFLGTGGSAHRAGKRSGFVDHGHHAAFRIDRFCAVGGYDASFSHNEDAELDCRQRAFGHRIYLDAEIRLSYHPRSTFTALAKQYFRYGKGRARTVQRHPRSLRLRQLAVPVHMLGVAACIVAGPLFPVLLVWPASYVAAVTTVGAVSALRRRTLSDLLIGPAAVTMHTAWAAGFFSGLLTQREHRWNIQQARAIEPEPGGSS